MSTSTQDKNDDLVQSVAGVTSDDQTNAAERRAKGEFVRGISTARNWISGEQGAMFPPAKIAITSTSPIIVPGVIVSCWAEPLWDWKMSSQWMLLSQSLQEDEPQGSQLVEILSGRTNITHEYRSLYQV
ncbi:glutathione Stransferase [Seminavis robusta]|uniref:Glutathione Stransferase n=1 Tax=Seminavis robusta TaxID=568900 RepID=A0A9N8HX19_9STRA|nr:glutathione Stransferase [Seminavis robusta]|eukprot:Sro2888_g339440.1 glutathione Stransferase (129) ;mRNA; r:98-484